MNKVNKLIPELRFPEFMNEGEWEITTIGKIGSFYYGKSAPKWSLAEDAPTLCVRYGELYTKFDTIISGIKSRTNIDPSDLKFSKGGEILVPRVGERATDFAKNCCYLPFSNIAIGEMISVFETKEFPIFYTHYFRTLWREFAEVVEGQNVKNLYYVNLESIKIGKPSYSEQQKIATCLSSLDEVIAVHSQKLEQLKEHKKGLMQNLFPQKGEKVPKYRFKEFEKDGEWVKKTIGDFIESHKGGASLTPSDFVTKSGFEVIPKKAIGEGMWLKIETPTYCSEDFYNGNEQSLVDSTYLITTLRDLVPSGPNIGYIVKYKSGKKYILAQGVYGLKIKDNLIPDFLIHFSNTKRYRKLVNAIMVGSTQVHIRNGEFFKIPINVPINIKEQQKTASCLSSLDALMTAQTKKIKQLKLHKKGLMQGLFPKMKD